MPVAKSVAKGVAKAVGKAAAKVEPAAAKRGAKATMKSAVKKTPAQWDAEFAAIEQQAKRKALVGGVALGATPLALMGATAYEMDTKEKARKAKETSRAKSSQSTDKFSWANRR